MENRIIALVAEHLLNEQFRSKKQMANALGLQYRTLLNACSGKCSSRCYEKVLNATLRYRDVRTGAAFANLPPALQLRIKSRRIGCPSGTSARLRISAHSKYLQ